MEEGKKKLRLPVALLIAIFFLSLTTCKGKPTIPEPPPIPPPIDNEISISCNPASGGTGTIVIITISIRGNLQEIESFGLDMTFDPDTFQYQGTRKGNLTAGWAEVNGNVTRPGFLIVGGFRGAGESIEISSVGDLGTIEFKVIYAGLEDNFTREITIKNYKDNIAGMNPQPMSAIFTYTK